MNKSLKLIVSSFFVVSLLLTGCAHNVNTNVPANGQIPNLTFQKSVFGAAVAVDTFATALQAADATRQTLFSQNAITSTTNAALLADIQKLAKDNEAARIVVQTAESSGNQTSYLAAIQMLVTDVSQIDFTALGVTNPNILTDIKLGFLAVQTVATSMQISFNL